MAMNIKKGDTIVVLSGKDKGKQGKVLGTVPKSSKIVAEGINMVTCHVKPRRQGEEGGIVKREAIRAPALLTRSRATRRSACASTAVQNCKKGAS